MHFALDNRPKVCCNVNSRGLGPGRFPQAASPHPFTPFRGAALPLLCGRGVLKGKEKRERPGGARARPGLGSSAFSRGGETAGGSTPQERSPSPGGSKGFQKKFSPLLEPPDAAIGQPATRGLRPGHGPGRIGTPYADAGISSLTRSAAITSAMATVTKFARRRKTTMIIASSRLVNNRRMTIEVTAGR